MYRLEVVPRKGREVTILGGDSLERGSSEDHFGGSCGRLRFLLHKDYGGWGLGA